VAAATPYDQVYICVSSEQQVLQTFHMRTRSSSLGHAPCCTVNSTGLSSNRCIHEAGSKRLSLLTCCDVSGTLRSWLSSPDLITTVSYLGAVHRKLMLLHGLQSAAHLFSSNSDCTVVHCGSVRHGSHGTEQVRTWIAILLCLEGVRGGFLG